MKKNVNVAKAIAKAVKTMGNISYGSASVWGIYQPKEPKKTKK